MASRDEKDLTPRVRDAWRAARELYKTEHPTKPQPFLTCTYRSVAEQNELYAQGRFKPGKIVTNARGGQSNHNHNPSPAFDIAFKDKLGNIVWDVVYFRLFAEAGRRSGLSWGGDWVSFKDYPHFELLEGK